jgi:putative hydrolase of the HAD superfamily
MIKCIIFDIGGVIVDFYNQEDYYPYLAKISGVPLKTVTRIIEYDIRVDLDKSTTTQQEFDREVAKQLGIKEKDIQWYEYYKKTAGMYKGTVSIIKRLHGKYVLAYLSNTDRSRYTYTVEKLLKPYLRLFKYRFASCDIRLRKPGRGIYRYALRHMRMKNSEVLFIDNQIENAVGARKVGIKSIWFKNSRDLEKRLKRMKIRL